MRLIKEICYLEKMVRKLVKLLNKGLLGFQGHLQST